MPLWYGHLSVPAPTELILQILTLLLPYFSVSHRLCQNRWLSLLLQVSIYQILSIYICLFLISILYSLIMLAICAHFPISNVCIHGTYMVHTFQFPVFINSLGYRSDSLNWRASIELSPTDFIWHWYSVKTMSSSCGTWLSVSPSCLYICRVFSVSVIVFYRTWRARCYIRLNFHLRPAQQGCTYQLV